MSGPFKTQLKFIVLRSQGYSFDHIAFKLKKSKQCLLSWNKQFREEISGMRAIELEKLYESYGLLAEHRIESLGKILAGIKAELQDRELSEVSTDKLLDLYLKFQDRTSAEMLDLKFKTTAELEEEKLDRISLDRLTAPPEIKKLKEDENITNATNNGESK
jgi:hypothetical protein